MARTVKFFIIPFIFLLILSFPVSSFGGEIIQLTDGDGTQFRIASDLDINANGQVIWAQNDIGRGIADVLLYDGQSNITSLTGSLSNFPLGSFVSPKLNDSGQAVWTGNPPLSPPEVFFYDGSIINRFATSSNTADLSINNDGQIVWTGTAGTGDFQGTPYSSNEIFSYQGGSITQLTNGGTLRSFSPSLSKADGYVSWITESTPLALSGGMQYTDVYLYHDGVTQRITNDSNGGFGPQVNSKGELAWLTLSGPNPGVNFYDGTEIKRLADFTSDDIASSPLLTPLDMNDAGQVVWNLRDDIFLFDGSQTIQLTDSSDQRDFDPRINASGSVAWMTLRDQNQKNEILLYDGLGIKQLESNAFGFRPQISDNGDVVWVRGEENNIFLYDADAVPPPPAKPGHFAFLIGVDYEKEDQKWAKDALKLSEALKKMDGWDNAQYIVLSTPNEEDITTRLYTLENFIEPGDEFLFYYSGHTSTRTFPDGGNTEARDGEPVVFVEALEENKTRDEAMMLEENVDYLTDEELEYLFNTDVWNSVEKTFIFDSCLAAGFWGSLHPESPDSDWDNRDLSNLSNTRLLAAAGEGQNTDIDGINAYLIDYLDNNPGLLNYDDWFKYVVSTDEIHKANVPIKDGDIDYSALYSFDPSPIYFSNIVTDSSWANEFGPVNGVVPEPATVVMFGLGIIGMIVRIGKKHCIQSRTPS